MVVVNLSLLGHFESIGSELSPSVSGCSVSSFSSNPLTSLMVSGCFVAVNNLFRLVFVLGLPCSVDAQPLEVLVIFSSDEADLISEVELSRPMPLSSSCKSYSHRLGSVLHVFLLSLWMCIHNPVFGVTVVTGIAL